ncbi:hypothetical protein [Halomonas sp. E19]|uniref:hypothetical protein n=1 Tax=Halomonas sp. E19 TaxID=3397247 RepID=UPI004034B5BE
MQALAFTFLEQPLGTGAAHRRAARLVMPLGPAPERFCQEMVSRPKMQLPTVEAALKKRPEVILAFSAKVWENLQQGYAHRTLD